MPNQLSSDPRYYEAILQLRPRDDKVLEFIKKRIEDKKNVFISRIDEVKTGLDIYISSQRFARSLGHRLKKSFDGKVVYSRKLFTVSRKTGKRVYRVTVLFRLNPKPINDS